MSHPSRLAGRRVDRPVGRRPAPRTGRSAHRAAARTAVLRAATARTLAVALLGAAGVMAPVAALPATAAPVPVEPEAQVVAVPELDDPAATTTEAGPDGSTAVVPDPGSAAPRVIEGDAVERADDAPDLAPPVAAPEAEPTTAAPVPEEDAAATDDDAPDADVPDADATGAADLPVAATGALETDDFRMLSVSWEPDALSDTGLERSEDSVVQVRVRTDDGWGEWEELGTEDAGPDAGTAEGRAARTTVATEPMWVSGGADGVDVRVTGEGVGSSSDVAVNLIDPKTSPADPGRPGGPAATANAATVGVPNVISRKQWGADESLRTRNCSKPDYASSAPKAIFVHHTAGTNVYSKDESAAIVRGVYYYHTQIQRWCDVGYNVLVDKYGQVFEGRYGGLDRSVIGAHTSGFNAESWAVSVLGNYNTARPTPAITGALSAVIGWKMATERMNPLGRTTLTSAGAYGTSRFKAGVKVPLGVLSAHRDVGFTSCPGDYLYSTLPALARSLTTTVSEQRWQARDSATPGDADHDIYYGSPGATALACDTDGDGRDGIAVFTDGTWRIRDDASSGAPDRTFRYGGPGTLPVCGDWDGDGRDGIGVYVPATGTWWLRERATDGDADRVFQYGFAGTVPVAGDWSRSGRDGIGVHDTSSGTWYLRGTADAGWYGAKYQYGFAGAQPVTGDWDGDGADSTGVMSDGQWYLRDSITPGNPDRRFEYGVRDDAAVTGSWSSDRRTGIAVVRTWPPV